MSEATGRARSRGKRTIAGRPVRRWLVDVALIVIGVACVVFEPVSIAIHSIAGLIFAAAVGPHLWDRRRWIRGTLTRLRHRRRMPARRRWSLAQGLVLLVLAVAVTVSGLWDWLGVPTRIRYHAITGVILIGVATWHAWTRRRALARRGSGSRGRGRRRPGPPARAPGPAMSAQGDSAAGQPE